MLLVRIHHFFATIYLVYREFVSEGKNYTLFFCEKEKDE